MNKELHWSCYFAQKKAPINLMSFKRKKRRTTIIKEYLYDYKLQYIPSNREVGIRKLYIQYISPIDSQYEPAIDTRIQKQRLEIEESPKDRYKIPIEILESGNTVCLTLLEGKKIEGVVLFDGEYTSVVIVDDNTWVWVFKHAVVQALIIKKCEFTFTEHDDEEMKKILRKRKVLPLEYIPILFKLSETQDDKVKERAEKKLVEIPVGKSLLDIFSTPVSYDEIFERRIRNTKKTKKSKKPKVVLSLRKIYEKINNEKVQRIMANAKIKVVLREQPKVKMVGDFLVTHLKNEPKNVPGSFPLNDTELDLFITKKMWKKAQKRADELYKTTEIFPFHVIEALISVMDNKIVAVASGIQVVEGKKKEEKQEK